MPLLSELTRVVDGLRRRGRDAARKWTGRRRARPPFKRNPVFEALEQRMLMSADVSGSIDIPGETDRYVFTLDRDKTLVFDSRSDSTIFWSLNGPRGAEVTSRQLRFSDAQNANPVLNLIAGDYELTVDASGDQTGDYRFVLLDASDATAITPGAPLAVTLSPGNGTAAFGFTGQAGERFYFDMQSAASSDGVWRLIDPHGVQVFSQ